jgi:hypothetical protein
LVSLGKFAGTLVEAKTCGLPQASWTVKLKQGAFAAATTTQSQGGLS